MTLDIAPLQSVVLASEAHVRPTLPIASCAATYISTVGLSLLMAVFLEALLDIERTTGRWPDTKLLRVWYLILQPTFYDSRSRKQASLQVDLLCSWLF
jgi:hypothetical protein